MSPSCPGCSLYSLRLKYGGEVTTRWIDSSGIQSRFLASPRLSKCSVGGPSYGRISGIRVASARLVLGLTIPTLTILHVSPQHARPAHKRTGYRKRLLSVTPALVRTDFRAIPTAELGLPPRISISADARLFGAFDPAAPSLSRDSPGQPPQKTNRREPTWASQRCSFRR